MTKEPLVTVLMTSYNTEDYVQETLDSLMAQTFSDFEAVIVDDASTDSTLDIVRSYASDPRFKLVCLDKNLGVGGARNVGLKHARGEWIAFLDTDDVWEPNKLELQVRHIQEHPDTRLSFTNGYTFGERGENRLFYKNKKRFPDGCGLMRILRNNCFYTSSVMVRRSDLIDTGWFRPEILRAADYDMWIRMFETGGVARGLSEPLVWYRDRPNSNTKSRELSCQSNLKIYSDAMARARSPIAKLVISRAAGKRRSDYHLHQARKLQPDTPGYGWVVRKELFLSWINAPVRTDPALRLLISLISGKKRLSELLRPSWSDPDEARQISSGRTGRSFPL